MSSLRVRHNNASKPQKTQAQGDMQGKGTRGHSKGHSWYSMGRMKQKLTKAFGNSQTRNKGDYTKNIYTMCE